jgi:hypothetical protein
MIQTMNQPSKRSKNRRHEHFRKIRMQRQISNWRKGLSLLAETGTGSMRKRGRFFIKKSDKYQS